MNIPTQSNLSPVPVSQDDPNPSATRDHVQIRDIMDPQNQHPKIKEKRTSAITHFDFYLSLKNKQLLSENKPAVVSSFKNLTYDDIDTGPYIAEYADYLSKSARKWCKPSESLISYASAAGYMGAVKNLLLDTYRSNKNVPKQLSTETWKRYMNKLRSTMWERCRKERKPMFGSKKSATEQDRYGIYAICIWDSTLHNAEFLNFFQSMVMNCGRGCEIGLTRFEHLEMKKIKESNGIEFDTLQQYINRT